MKKCKTKTYKTTKIKLKKMKAGKNITSRQELLLKVQRKEDLWSLDESEEN